jgi:hypothetical protein
VAIPLNRDYRTNYRLVISSNKMFKGRERKLHRGILGSYPPRELRVDVSGLLAQAGKKLDQS